MIYISHRGNIAGPIISRENSPDYIDEAISLGYDVEIDLRMKDNKPHLGHDHADHQIDFDWLNARKESLWIHVKEYEALKWIRKFSPSSTYFCHESDRFTLTSNGYVWSHDLLNDMSDFCIVPLLDLKSIETYDRQANFFAVCTDYVSDCIKKFEKKS